MIPSNISLRKILWSNILLILLSAVSFANFRMIDFPLTQTSVNADTFLSEENLVSKIDVIWSYEDDGWRYWAPAGRTDITGLLTSYTRLSELRQGLGYMVRFNTNSADVSFENKSIHPNSVRLSSTNYSLASFNLDTDISLESLFAEGNISGGTKSDIEEVWQYDSNRKVWLFYSADSNNTNFNNFERLISLARGTSIWIKSKVAGLEIRLNNESPVISISGTSTLVPPAITNPSPSVGFGDFTLQNTEVTGLCKFDGTDTEPIGIATLVTSNGEQLASTNVFCPSSGGQKVQYSLALTPTVINHLNEFPESGKNSVVRILLNSGQEQKSLIHSDLKTKIDNDETSVTANLDTTSSFVVAVAEMELAKRAGIAADQVNLGVSGNSNSGDVLDLSKVWGADDYPIDMIRFQELVNTMIPEDPFGTEPQNHIHQMFKTIEDLNDPSVDSNVRQSVSQFFTTTPQDSTKRIQSLLSASMDLISANVEAEKKSVLSGTTNPVEICAQKLLEVNPDQLAKDATDNLINACNLVEENVKLAVSVVGDPSAKKAALQNITELANNFDSETLSRIATSPTPFEFLNLTSRLVSFPKNLVDALGDNQSASAALAALLGQSAELLAQAKGIDAQAALQNNTRQAEILAAIKALEAENARLEKVFTISSDPDEIVKRMADYIANGGDPSKINEVSDLLEDSFADGTPIDYGKLIDEVRKTTHNPVDIITDLIKSSSDKSLGMKVFAESAHLLSAEQLNKILNDKAIKDEFALDRNLIALAGRDKEIRVRDGSYTLSLNGSRSFDPQGDTNLRYTWHEIDKFRGTVISTLGENSASPQVNQILSSPDGFKYYRLTVTNIDGSKSSEDEIRIKFFRHPLPVVIFSPTYISVEPNNLVTASVADSYYPEGDTITSFNLEQVSGPTANATLTGTELSFTPTVAGAYVFKVSATVNEATTDVTGSNLLTVRVRDQFPPEVDAGPDAQIKISTSHKLENFSFSPNEAKLTYQWSPALFLDSASIQQPTFTPQEDGEYEFTLTVTDEFGNTGEDKVRIEVVRSFPPIAVTTESVEVDFRALSTDVVAINLDGCRSFGIDLPITNYSWKSTTYTSSIDNSSSCSTQIKIYETNYTEPGTEHFFLTVGDGKSTNEGTFSVHVLPSTSLPPQIILDTFPEKNIYTAGEELDIESWKSFSYNDKPLLFSWIPLNQDSRRISKTLRSRFQGIQRDTLEVSVPNPLGTTNTITKTFQYQLTVTERNADNTLGLSSSQIVNIKAAQVCPISPVIRSLKASQLTYRIGSSMNVLELEADYAARCQTADGQDHPLQLTWGYDSSIFIPTTTAVTDSIVLTLAFDGINNAPVTKDITFSVKDTVNSSYVTETVSVEILPILTCELAFSFPGNEANSRDIYTLTPERSYVLAGNFDCVDPLLVPYPDKTSEIKVYKFPVVINESGTPTPIGPDVPIYANDRGNSAPVFEFTTTVPFAGAEQSGFRITVDDFDLYNSLLTPIYANLQYQQLQPRATIAQRRDNFGGIKQINATEYEEKTTASVLSFRLDASRSKNPNTTPGALSFNWAVIGDSSNISLTSHGTTATAIVSGLAPFELKEWTIQLAVSDQSGKATSATTDLKIKVEQDNLLPILTNLQIPGRNIYNNVSVTFDLYDFEGEHSSIQFEYSTDGAQWLTSAATVERSEPLSNTSPGFFKGFIWQAQQSLPSGNYASAQIRLTPTDTYGRLGNTEVSDPFFLSVPLAPQLSATIIDRICRDSDGETTVNVESNSYNGGCVTETIDFHIDGYNDPHPYEDSFRFSWSSNSITTYQFVREIFKQNARWDFGEEAEAGRMDLSAVEYKSKLYFWGGTVLTAKEVFNTVYIYDPKSNQWSQGSAGGTGRRLHSAALHNGSIYHYGGRLAAFEGEKDPSTELQGLMDVYTIDTNSWKTIQTTTLDVGFRNNLAVVYDSKLYQFGGWKPVARGTRSNSDYENNMYIFDFSTNTWEEKVSSGAPTIAELEPMTANLHDGKIYYSGGQASGMYRRIWSYEIGTGNWARSTPADPVPWKEAFGSFSAQSSNYSYFTPTNKWSINGNPYFSAGNSISIAPAMNRTESQIYLSGDKFFAINSQTGAEVCNYKAHYTRFAAPAIGPDESIHVTANGDKALVVLNPDCSLKWRTDNRNEFPALQDQNFESLAKSMNHVRRPAIGADGTIYAPSNKTLLAISPTGKILWRFVAVATVSRPVIGGDGVIYFGTSGGRGRNRQYKVYAVNPDGKKKWELGLKDSVPRVASINKNEVIFFKGMESLYAVDKEGKILWYYKLKKRSPYTAYHDEDNTVYVTDGDYLYSLNQDGSLKWRIKGGFRDNPVVGRAGIIYVGSNDKHFYAIDRDGRIVWKYQTNNKVGAFPKLSADGTVYFVNQSKRLYALNVESEGMVDSAWPTFQGDNQNSGRFYVRDQDPAVPDPVIITPPDPGTPGNKKWFFAGCEDNNFMVHPALDSEGTLYFACNQPTSKFFAINPDGTEKWNHDYNNRGIIPHISAPAITPDDNLIYTVGGTCSDTDNSFIECNRGLLVKATPNGTIIWEREIKIETPTSPALGPDGTIYLSSWQLAPGEATDYGRIAAYNPDGELKWSFKTAGSIFPPVVGGDGTVYQVTYQDQSDKSQRRKSEFDSEEFQLLAYYPEGELKWSFNLDSSASMVPALNTKGDLVIVTRRSVSSISRDGELNWSEPLKLSHDPFQKLSPAIDKNGVIYISESRSPNSRLISYTSTGKQSYSTSFRGAPRLSSPTIGRDGTVYIGAGTFGKGRYYSVNSSGVLTPTTFSTDSPSLGSSVIATDGTVYFGTQTDGKIYAITSKSFGLRKGGWPKFKHENQSTSYMGAYDDDYGRGGDGTKPPVDIEDPTEDEDYDKEGPGTDPSQPPSDESTPPSDSQPPGDGNTDPIVIKPTEPPSSGFPTLRTKHASVVHGGKIYFYGGDTGFANGYFTAHSNSVDIYDIANDRWEWGIAAPVGRSAHSGAKVSDTFYFWGGSDGEEAQKTLEIFRPESMRTELLYRVATNYTELTHNVTYKASFGLEIEPAQRKISNHASAIWKDKLFILGGEDENGITNQVTVYDVSTSKIKVSTFALTRLYHARKNAAAAVWRDKLIVTGGENANGPQAFAEVYDLGANGATLLANYKVEGLEAVASHSAEVWEDKLYLIGGYGSEGQTSPNSHIVSFELKDTSAKSLGTTSFTNLTTSRYGHASTIMRGTLYIMGGSSGNADLNSVEGYQLLAEGPSKLNSNQVPNLLTARKEHAAVTYGDKIVLAGGSQGGFNNTTPIYSNAIEVLQLVPSNLNSNLVIRNHPSFGAEDLNLARAGLKAEMVSDLMVNTGGLGNQYPASTLEVLKFTGNNAQQALASANGSALLTFTLKRLKPTAIISTPTVSGTGGVLTICFDITDPTGVPATISLEVSENGGDTWSTASPIEGLSIDLSAIETGTNRCLTWDTGVSYPGNYRDMVVRIKASDGSVSPASNLFDIINSPAYVKQLPVVSNLTRGNSDRGNIDFTYDIEDGNGDSSAIEIFYFDGLELQPIEVLEDVSPGTGRIYTWNSSTYESTYLSSTYLLMLPTDSVVGEEGTSDQTQLFSLNNGQLSFDTISVTAGCNGTVMVVTNSQYYECGNTTNSTAFFALDASSAINDNEGEGINFNWQLKEELAGATLENFDSALATLTITDDGIVSASNVERVIEIVASASQAGIGGKTLEVSSQLILSKPPVSANAAIIAYSCDGLISTSNSISCTGNTARITLDGSNSINPNNGGTYIVWNSTPSATVITSDQHSVTYEISNLPTAFTSYTFTAEAFDNPNGVNSSSVDLSLAVKKRDNNNPVFDGGITVQVEEDTGIVTVSAYITDVGNGLVYPSLENMFSRNSGAVTTTPVQGSISGLSASYQTPSTISFVWDSKAQINSCEEGVAVGISLTDEEGHVTSASSAEFDLWNCGASGSVTGTISLSTPMIISTGNQGSEPTTHCVYDSSDNLLTTSNPLGVVTLFSVGGKILTTGPILCNAVKGNYPTYQLDLELDLRLDAKEESKILENSILEADFNSGQFFGLIDVQDHATEIANATPNNLASWQVDMDEKANYFYYFIRTIEKSNFGEENFYNQLPPTGSLDLDTLKESIFRGFNSTDSYYITTEGYVHQMLLAMKDSGKNSPSTTLQLENEFLGFFDQQPGKLLGFKPEQREALVGTFSTLKDLIIERSGLNSSSPLTSVLDTMIGKLMRIGIPGTVEGDSRTTDPGSMCNYNYFSQTIADLLDRTISLANQTMGTGFQFAGQEKLDNIINELSSPGLLEPTSCDAAELTLTRLIQESIDVSDEFLEALAQNTQAAKDMAAMIGEANAALASKNASAVTSLSTSLAEISELDLYLKKLSQANDKLKTMANATVDSNALEDILAESIKESSKSTGGTVGLIGLIKDLSDNLGNGSSVGIDFGSVIDKVVEGNEVNKVEFISDILEQEENQASAAEIFEDIATDLGRDELQFIIDNQFPDSKVIYANIGQGKEILVKQGETFALTLSVNDLYDPNDKNGTDTYHYHWTVSHENPSVPTVSFSSTESSTTFEFENVDTEFEFSVFDLVLDNPLGSLRTISLEIENIDKGSRSRILRNNYVFYNVLPPVADAGRYASAPVGTPLTLDASGSYLPDPSESSEGYIWLLVSYPSEFETVPDIPNDRAMITNFRGSIPGMYEFKLSYYGMSNGIKQSDEDFVKKYFYEKPPLAADAGYDALIPPNTPYKLVNNSFAQDPSNLVYSWDPPAYLDDPNIKEPIFTASVDGKYELTLKVEDNLGQVKSDKVIVTVQSKRKPYVSAGEHQEYQLSEGQNSFDISLDASSSFSYQGETLSFEWIGESYISGPISPSSSNTAITSFQINPADYTHEGKLTFTVKATDSSGYSTRSMSVRIIPPAKNPIVIVKKDPLRRFYRSTESLKLVAADSYSRQGKRLSFDYEQILGPQTSIAQSPTGAHIEAMDSASITLPSFEEDLVKFGFRVSVIDLSSTTAFLEIATSTQDVFIDGVPLQRKPIIRDVPCTIETRIENQGEQPTLTINASNSRTLDHDDQDLRHPLAFNWVADTNILSIQDSSGSSSTFKFKVNTNAAELAPGTMGDSYTTSVQLMVTDTVNNKTATKDIQVVIYPAFNPVKFTFDYHEKYRIVNFSYPFYDDVSDQYIYKCQSTCNLDILSYTASFDNSLNIGHPDLTHSNIVGPAGLSLTKDSGTSSALFTLAAAAQSSNVTKVTTTDEITLSGEASYHMDMEGGLSNGEHFSKRFSMFVTDSWIPLSLNPILVKSVIDNVTQTDHNLAAEGALIQLLGDKAVITLDAQGLNQNGGDVDYSFAMLPSSYPTTLSRKGNGIVELALTLPENRETVAISIVAADSLGRSDINIVPDLKGYASVNFDVRKERSQPSITLLTDTVEILDNQFLQARFNLVDPDKDFNDIVLHYSVDNSPYLTAVSVQGETRVQEGSNYTIRWYFKTDGSFYIDNRQDVTIKLNANDGSYYDPVDSNTHTMNFEVDTPWSDYTGGYLSVENVLELTNSTFLETEPNGIQRDVQPLIRAKAGDSFQLQGKVSYLTDIRDSFRFEVEGTASLNVSWMEGDLQYRPELGVYDVHAAKFIYFDWESLDEISNVILNAHGGLREYELVLFHPSENGGEYKLEVEVNDLELGGIQKIREIEPNNTAFDAQYLGNLSRSLSYDLNGKGGDSKGSDFYEFDIFGVYPMQFSLYPYITSDEVELSVSLWDSNTGKQIRHFSRKDELHGFMHLSEGRYLIEVNSSQKAPYLLRLQQGDDSNSNTQGLTGTTTAALYQPNRRVPVGINYFEGLYKGNYTEIVSGELTFVTPDNSNSNIARSVMRVGSVGDARSAPRFQTIKLSLPKTVAARSSTGQMTANYSSYDDMADRYANIFHTIEALESYRTNYGNEQVQHTHYYYSTAIQPDDTKYATGNMWNIDAINLPEAWEITKGSKDVIVAVIDGGPAYHKDIMSSPTDPDGKYIQGYDFVSMDNDPFISSGNIHGGHVAGTIGAKANNGEGVVGKNWEVSIMPLRVCPGRSCSGNAILNAILYAAGLPNSSGTVPPKPADVMNMSLGGPGINSPTHPYNTAMQSAVSAGTLPVCAAGNNGKDTDVTFFTPCGFDSCMCVSAISPNLSPAGFTNYGSHIDISAPGVQIWSTVLNDRYEAWAGTSMASPHVAGVAGLIKSLNPNLTPQELRDFLEQTSTDLGNPGRDDHFGVGFLNAFKAAEAVGEDSGVFGPKLGAVPSSIAYGEGAAYQELTIVNKGSDDINALTWSVQYTTASTYDWLVFRPEAGFGATASKLGIYADKYHLSQGDHSAIITIDGVHLQSGEAVDALTIPVTVTVAQNEVIYPLIKVEAIENGIIVTHTYTHYNEGYHYVLDGLSEGQVIQIRAGTDFDHDGEICDATEKWCGTLGGFSNPTNVNILDGSYRADLRFDVSNFEEGYYYVPEIQNLNLPANGGGDIVFSFDSHSSHLTEITAHYRENGVGAFASIPSTHISTSLNTIFETGKTATWYSKETLPLGNGSVEFMLTTSSTIGGSGLSQTVTFTILNNSRPDVSNLKVIPENQSSYERDLSIRADISEPDSEPTSLTIEYSLNGDNGPWRKATSVSGKVSGIVSETAKLVWHSNYDFDTDQVGVKIKIIVDDGNTQPRELVYPLNTTLTVNNGPIELSSWSDMPNRTATATIRCDEADGAIYDNKLYAICADLTGSLGGGRVSIFDFTTNTWEVESNEINLVQSRSDYTSTLVNGQFYTYGGQNSGSAVNASTNSLLQIDPTTSSVNTILSEGIARRNHTAVGYENKLYIHGGILDEGFSTTNTMDIFDTITNQWSTGSPSPSNRYGHDSVLYNGKIYLFGGRSQVGANDVFLNVEVYDISTNSWSTISNSLVFQTYGTATLIDGLIYLIGGEDDFGQVVDVFIFDPESSQFLESDPIVAPAVSSRKDHLAAAYNGRIYVFGPPSDSFQRYTPKNSNKTLVSFSRKSAEIIEGNWNLSVSVRLTTTSDQNVSVDYVLSDDNSASSADFNLTSGTLNFSAGQQSQSISYSIIDDLDQENLESFTIQLINPTNLSLGDQSSYTFTIIDDD